MTRLFDKSGNNVPVTIVEAGPCVISQVKTDDRDGYSAIQLAFGEVKARNSTMPIIGHDAGAGIGPRRTHREFRVDPSEIESYQLGQELDVTAFENVMFVDVCGTSKGKGTAGVMKRHGFKGMSATHGTERKHRSPGSICGRSSNRGTGKPKKGIRMGGHMGDERVTVRSLEIVACDKAKNLLLIKGAIPGGKQAVIEIREAKRLYKQKAARLAEASK
jgi:large subunit ribosomal protein L3